MTYKTPKKVQMEAQTGRRQEHCSIFFKLIYRTQTPFRKSCIVFQRDKLSSQADQKEEMRACLINCSFFSQLLNYELQNDKQINKEAM